MKNKIPKLPKKYRVQLSEGKGFLPNQNKHLYVSLVKPGIRILACGFGLFGELQVCFALFALAEVLIIFKELM